ncbi:hypothetical protein [Pedobacter agri]|uniref:hypothetical protein n=1 Tax=Pedobacter agri TaxID=454586 RepID=UPI00292FDEBA|nr:hypothetical protein [Pedobacter agri]
MPFKISKKYTNIHWTELNLVTDKSDGWINGISIIKDRFNSRFFDQINNVKIDPFSGFIVMSIDCLLIETLMQFYLGVDDTEFNYKGVQWKAFRDFFKNSIYFKSEFKTNSICKTFYTQFRCGLLHQAQTKKKSLIKINQPKLLKLINPLDAGAGLIIDRVQFHDNLVLEFQHFIQKLKDNENNFLGNNLRINAALKMNLLCIE